jgi:Spy/CpxP family protein refolding chaperone
MLKHCLLALTLAGLIYTITPAAVAQDTGSKDLQAAPSAAPPEHGPGYGHMDPAKRTAMLAKRLNLNSDQQSKVQDILKSEQSQMESLRADTSVSQQDRRSKMMEIHKSTNNQIRGLLDPDQQKKWDEMQSRREEWMQGHHHGGQAPGGPPDSSQPQQ